MSIALANTLTSATLAVLNDEFITSLMHRHTKIENWLQVELANGLRSSDNVTDVHLEASIENIKELDLACCPTDGSKVGIEIKMFVCGKAVSDARKSIQRDIQNCSNCRVVVTCWSLFMATSLGKIASQQFLVCAAYKESPPHKQHIWFLLTQKPTLKKPKSCFLPTLDRKVNRIRKTAKKEIE